MIHVVVVSGTVGVGKTTVATAISDALAPRGLRVALIDVDYLCQVDPAPSDDRYGQELAFANLRAVLPNYLSRGVEYFSLARVIEDPSDRATYDDIFQTRVQVVRLEAPLDERRERLIAREPEGRWRDWHLNRTDELATILQGSNCEDFVVANAGRPASSTAAEIIELLGW